MRREGRDGGDNVQGRRQRTREGPREGGTEGGRDGGRERERVGREGEGEEKNKGAGGSEEGGQEKEGSDKGDRIGDLVSINLALGRSAVCSGRSGWRRRSFPRIPRRRVNLTTLSLTATCQLESLPTPHTSSLPSKDRV
eukprot:764000-Hanusia_phi.AAC.2